jgi:hypothetical protein
METYSNVRLEQVWELQSRNFVWREYILFDIERWTTVGPQHSYVRYRRTRTQEIIHTRSFADNEFRKVKKKKK